MTATASKRAFLYGRVSTNEQALGRSVEVQIEKVRKYADLKDWEVVGEFTDPGISGAKALHERPEGARLLAAARRGEADVVVFTKLDRFARSVIKALDDSETLEGLGVELVFVEEDIDTTTPQGRLFRTLLAAFAEFERDTIRSRNMGGRYANAKAGQWAGGGVPPFGLAKNDDGFLVLDERAADVVRFAYARAIGGDSLSEVTRRLNGEFPTFEGQRGAIGFTPGSVKRWLTLPGYKGEGFVQRIARDHGFEREEIVTPAPAIVTADEWASAVESLRASRASWRSSQDRPEGDSDGFEYALAGRVYHDHEKSGPVALYGVTPGSRAAKRRTRYYRCSNSTARYKERYRERAEFDACEGWGVNPQNKRRRRISVRASEAEAHALHAVVMAFRSSESLAELRDDEDRRAVAAAESEDTLEAAYRERDALDTEELNLAKRLGRLSTVAADVALESLDARRAENEDRIARLEVEAEEAKGFDELFAEVVELTRSCLDIHPGDGAAIPAFEAGGLRVETVGPEWVAVTERLAAVADEVLDGSRTDLPEDAARWLERMARRFGITTTIEHGEGTEYHFRIRADRGRLFGEVGQVIKPNTRS